VGGARTGQLVFVPSYFDYVRVRAMLKEDGAEFAALSEYAQVGGDPTVILQYPTPDSRSLLAMQADHVCCCVADVRAAH
jgi:hypothetical protein